MWLPKEEQRLLAGYWLLIRDINQDKVYPKDQLASLFHRKDAWQSVLEYGAADTSPDHQRVPKDNATRAARIKSMIDDQFRLDCANTRLATRGYITLKQHQHLDDVCIIALTISGFDLGRRYANWWDRSAIWFEAYRNHWIWLIVGFVGGILGSTLVALLK